MSEFKMTIDRGGNAPSDGGKLAAAKVAAEEAAEQVRTRRAGIHKRHKDEAAGRTEEAAEKKPPAEPIQPREDLEFIEFDLPDGRTIKFGPPRGISLTDRIARLYGDRDPTVSQHRLARVLMCVQEINGRPVDPITDEIERTNLANKIGDTGIELLYYFERLHWPPLRVAELPAIRKKLRA